MSSPNTNNYDQLQELVNALELATLNPAGLAPQVNSLRTRVINALNVLNMGGGGVGSIVAGTGITASGTGTVTISLTNVISIASGTGITCTPNPIIASGTVAIANTAVTPATYGDATHVPTITIDQQGRITAASSTAISGGGGSVTSIAAGAGITCTPNPITATGTIAVSGSGGGRPVDPSSSSWAYDDFITGDITTKNIGQLRWAATVNTMTYTTGVANHPGLFTLAATANIRAIQLEAGSASDAAYFLYSDFFDCYFILRTNSTTNITFRCGLFSSGSSTQNDPPSNMIVMERLSTDTNWFGVTGASIVYTRVDTTIAGSTNFIKLRIRRIDASTIGFTADGATEVTSTTNIPTGACFPLFQLKSISGAQTADVDYWDNLISPITR